MGEKITARLRMGDSSPLKRRRTRGSFAMKPKKVIAIWPKSSLPVEIFTLIISYLPRSNIQDMRLVNKEFEEKVSEFLFRVVVVPFKPEIYGITPEPSLFRAPDVRANNMLQGSVMLQDKGMRVFQGFGRRIRKFAMSFEFDENKLASPPVKSDQEAITAFWGIYRWPFKKYNRYSQLEGLEQTADETRTMAKALRFIECAKELGLSIDGGLGWLAGPDINQKVIDRGEKVKVFGESRFVPEPKPKILGRAGKLLRAMDPLSSLGGDESSAETPYSSFERMLREAGYSGDALEPSVRMLLETEEFHRELPRSQLLETLSNTFTWQNFTRNSLPQTIIESNSFTQTDPGESSLMETYDTEGEEENEIAPALPSIKGKSKGDNHSLKPNDLTNAQREMLLETEWAQRAFMQSYAIAIIDNPLTFRHIETLTIARLPTRHLPILRREDFWDSLPQLNKLSLAIIPDWREVAKLPTSWVQDIRILPSQSLSVVYQVLLDQVARRRNIKSLHFEWLCGGEEAPGLFSRNQHILAAPIVSKAMDMVNRAETPDLLSLPYVEHLSLKNCWISPHVLAKFGMSFRKCSLRSFTLNSVSLTAPVPPDARPNPVTTGHGANAHHAQQIANHAAANNLLLNLQGLVGANAANAPVPPALSAALGNVPSTDPEWLQPPRPGSWAAIIEILTPASTLAEQRYSRDIGSKPSRRDTGQLTKFEFESCGYVRIPLDFDQTILDLAHTPASQSNAITKRISDLDSFMMKSQDYTLGTILNHMDALEARTLENGFLLNVGWNTRLDPFRAVLSVEAAADGILHPGQGRFGGVVEKDRGA